MERSFYSRETAQSEFYERLLEDVKRLSRHASAWPEERRNLLIAAYILLGEAYARESHYREAIGVYEVALTLLHEESDLRAYLLNNIGVAYMDAKELARARNFFEKALAEKPRYARPLLNLGNVLMEMRDFGAAERTYGTALEEHPGYPNALYAMGRFYMEIRKNEAFERLNQSTRECLRRQAQMAITEYVATLEAEEVVRSLSIEEKMDVQRGRGMLDEIGPGKKNGGAKDTRPGPGRCLAGDVRGN